METVFQNERLYICFLSFYFRVLLVNEHFVVTITKKSHSRLFFEKYLILDHYRLCMTHVGMFVNRYLLTQLLSGSP